MELTFVNQYSGDPPKRRRLAKACEACRARKKRCMHYSSIELDDNDDDEYSSRPDGQSNGDHDATNEDGIEASNSETLHFVSDLEPQSTLLRRRAPSNSTPARKRANEDIGIWVDRAEYEALLRHRNVSSNAQKGHLSSSSMPPSSSSTSIPPTISSRVDTRPHSAVLGILIDIYFAKIHPILPILSEKEFRRQHTGGLIPEPLVHAMCLAAAKDASAEPHLRLNGGQSATSAGGTGTTVSARRFCSVMHASVTAALNVPVRFEKVMLIRILALTWLHNEGPDGAEEASIRLSKAVHHAQTLGIHLGNHASSSASHGLPGSDVNNASTSTADDDDDMQMKRLFWSLYALDRMNAAINGRPIVMSDADIASAPFAPGESGFPAFEAWLAIIDLLNRIISFYRPTAGTESTGWEDAYPGLEELLDALPGAWELPPSVLATIHLFYLSVAILSHRTRGMREMPRGLSSQVRQRLCAIEVIRLLQDSGSFTHPSNKEPRVTTTASTNPSSSSDPDHISPAQTLNPLPIIPYALSLALSVSYQHLRQSQLPHQQSDALRDFRSCCSLLQNLSKRHAWRSADVMAALGSKVLAELERAGDLGEFRVRRAGRDSGVVSGRKESGAGAAGAGTYAGSENGIGVRVGSRRVETNKKKKETDVDGNAAVAAAAAAASSEEMIPPPTACHHGVGAVGSFGGATDGVVVGDEGAEGVVAGEEGKRDAAAGGTGGVQEVLPASSAHSYPNANNHHNAASSAEAVVAGQQLQQTTFDGASLFNDIDDVFGTFMDPNYPLSLDDMSFLEDFTWDIGNEGGGES